MKYTIYKGLSIPSGRRTKRTSLDKLVLLAQQMEVGEAVELDYSEAQTFRIVLAGQGFDCITDGYNTQSPGKLLAFKLKAGHREDVVRQTREVDL